MFLTKEFSILLCFLKLTLPLLLDSLPSLESISSLMASLVHLLNLLQFGVSTNHFTKSFLLL